MNDWIDIDLNRIDTPALLIDKEMVSHNITAAINHAGGVHRLRPHVKTHKMLEVAEMQRQAGITKFKCATIPEAEMLGMVGASDVLIAYQPQGPKIERVYNLQLAYPSTHYAVLIDNYKSARHMHDFYDSKNRSLDVYIDINDGHDRTGIRPEEVDKLISRCEDLESVSIIGLHCYDGHIRMPDLSYRIKECTQAYKSVLELKGELESNYNLDLNMVAGGSPSFSVHAAHHDVECSPGTWIFWDERYASDYKEQPFVKAAVVATRVISKINATRYCLDLGHKSIASEFPFPRVKFLTDLNLKQVGHSEEHLIVASERPDALEVGQLLLGYPYHICPTVALYDSAYIVSNKKVVDNWKVIARDRKITI